LAKAKFSGIVLGRHQKGGYDLGKELRSPQIVYRKTFWGKRGDPDAKSKGKRLLVGEGYVEKKRLQVGEEGHL